MNVLAVDVGHSVNLWHTAHEKHRRFSPGKSLTPEQMLAETKATAPNLHYDSAFYNFTPSPLQTYQSTLIAIRISICIACGRFFQIGYSREKMNC